MATSIFDHAHAKIFQSTLNFYESASICKKSGFIIKILDGYLKILLSDWSRAFWPISHFPKIFSKYGICAWIKQILQYFFIDQIQKKLMTKFSINSKNPVFGPFWVHFPNFWGKNNFPGKSSSVTPNFIWVSCTITKFRKIQWCNSKKTPGQTEGRKDGRTNFNL